MADITPTVQAEMDRNSLNNQNSTLSFPGEVQNFNYYTRMVFEKYQRSRPESGKTTKVSATIILPLPDDFGDTDVIGWNGSELGIFGASLGDFTQAYEGLKKAGFSAAEQFGLGGLQGAMAGGQTALTALGLAAMVVAPKNMRDGQIQNLGMATLGSVPNPHLTALFEGVPLRNHTLRWTLSPRNEKDAKTLGNIINKIRVLSRPSYNKTVSRFALDYPDTVTVTFEGVDKEFKTQIFKSVVTGFQTDLAPKGPSMNPNGRPGIVSMGMSLMETEIVVREDLGGKGS